MIMVLVLVPPEEAVGTLVSDTGASGAVTGTAVGGGIIVWGIGNVG